MNETANGTPQSLLDKEEIREVITRLGVYTDHHRWEDLRKEVFSAEVFVDYTALAGGEPSRTSADDLVGGWESTLGNLKATQHMISNFLIDLGDDEAGEEASCSAYFRAQHYLPNDLGEPLWALGGTYDIELVKESGEVFANVVDRLPITRRLSPRLSPLILHQQTQLRPSPALPSEER